MSRRVLFALTLFASASWAGGRVGNGGDIAALEMRIRLRELDDSLRRLGSDSSSWEGDRLFHFFRMASEPASPKFEEWRASWPKLEIRSYEGAAPASGIWMSRARWRSIRNDRYASYEALFAASHPAAATLWPELKASLAVFAVRRLSVPDLSEIVASGLSPETLTELSRRIKRLSYGNPERHAELARVVRGPRANLAPIAASPAVDARAVFFESLDAIDHWLNRTGKLKGLKTRLAGRLKLTVTDEALSLGKPAYRVSAINFPDDFHVMINGPDFSELGDDPAARLVRDTLVFHEILPLLGEDDAKHAVSMGWGDLIDALARELVAAGDVASIRELAKRGFDPGSRDHWGSTLLHLSVKKRLDLDMTRYLIEAGADVDTPDALGLSPLQTAARLRKIDVFDLISPQSENRCPKTREGRMLHELPLLYGSSAFDQVDDPVTRDSWEWNRACAAALRIYARYDETCKARVDLESEPFRTCVLVYRHHAR